MAGDPFETQDPMLNWSLRDIFADLGNAEGPLGIVIDISLSDTVVRLAKVAQLDTTRDFMLSWRAALEAAAAV
jgi:hypothetical protein